MVTKFFRERLQVFVRFTTMCQITTLTFFRYRVGLARLWAFNMMQFAHRPMGKQQGLQFYKLLGSGRSLGFNPFPDWGTYAILQIWDSQAAADAYFTSALHQRYQKKAKEVWTLYLRPIQCKGLWSGGQPFQIQPPDPALKSLAVITRASIRWRQMWKFWQYVPISQRPIDQASGLLYTKGVGEVPFVQMATFSLWENEAALRKYAYESPEHLEAIRRTRELDWYGEEMFVRFQPYASRGTWNGEQLLKTDEKMPA